MFLFKLELNLSSWVDHWHTIDTKPLEGLSFFILFPFPWCNPISKLPTEIIT